MALQAVLSATEHDAMRRADDHFWRLTRDEKIKCSPWATAKDAHEGV
jgi:hypothetical protein